MNQQKANHVIKFSLFSLPIIRAGFGNSAVIGIVIALIVLGVQGIHPAAKILIAFITLWLTVSYLFYVSEIRVGNNVVTYVCSVFSISIKKDTVVAIKVKNLPMATHTFFLVKTLNGYLLYPFNRIFVFESKEEISTIKNHVEGLIDIDQLNAR